MGAITLAFMLLDASRKALLLKDQQGQLDINALHLLRRLHLAPWHLFNGALKSFAFFICS